MAREKQCKNIIREALVYVCYVENKILFTCYKRDFFSNAARFNALN